MFAACIELAAALIFWSIGSAIIGASYFLWATRQPRRRQYTVFRNGSPCTVIWLTRAEFKRELPLYQAQSYDLKPFKIEHWPE